MYTGWSKRSIRPAHKAYRKALEHAEILIYTSQWAAQSAIRDYGADPKRFTSLSSARICATCPAGTRSQISSSNAFPRASTGSCFSARTGRARGRRRDRVSEKAPRSRHPCTPRCRWMYPARAHRFAGILYRAWISRQAQERESGKAEGPSREDFVSSRPVACGVFRLCLLRGECVRSPKYRARYGRR